MSKLLKERFGKQLMMKNSVKTSFALKESLKDCIKRFEKNGLEQKIHLIKNSRN